jgi:hypothetical protein
LVEGVLSSDIGGVEQNNLGQRRGLLNSQRLIEDPFHHLSQSQLLLVIIIPCSKIFYSIQLLIETS